MKVNDHDKASVVGELIKGLGRGLLRVGTNVLDRGGLKTEPTPRVTTATNITDLVEKPKQDVNDEFEFFEE